MKALATVFASLTLSGLCAQISHLDVHNPGPRLNDEIEVLITLHKIGAADQSLDKEETVVRDQQLGRGNIILRHVASDTGVVNIGPFKFSIAGKEYVTDVLSLRVYPPLSPKVHDGLWARVIQFKEESYLIIEQRVGVKWKKEQKSSTEYTMKVDTDAVVFASLDEDKFESAGLSIISSSSRSESQNLDKDDPQGSGTVTYKRATYKFKKKPEFTGKFKLDKKFFVDFPARGVTEEVWIQ